MNTKKAFTLIELMIAITIMVILTMAAYAPYSYYQNKAKLKVTTREVSQLLYESRNMAINWAVWNDWNISIWVYFDANEKDKVKIFSYPYDIDSLDISYIQSTDIKLLKTLILRKWIQIDNVDSKQNLLFVFDAITWDISYYTWVWANRTTIDLNNSDNDIINIWFSYKWSSSPNLNKTINYFTNTNIIDY